MTIWRVQRKLEELCGSVLAVDYTFTVFRILSNEAGAFFDIENKFAISVP